MTNHYATLGVDKGSTIEEIKRAYKKKAVEHHPDKGGDAEEFKRISHAYSVLSDADKRRRYDQLGDRYEDGDGGDNGHPFAASFDPNDIFRDVFGGGFPFGNPFARHQQQQQNQQRRHHLHKLRIGLKEAFTGTKKQIKVDIQKTCFTCVETCKACQGQGHVNDMVRMGFMTQIMMRACERCEGRGSTKAGKKSCTTCKGACTTKEESVITVDIPKGVQTGNQIRFPGLGEQAEKAAELPGDLIFEIHVADDGGFRRDGDNLHYETTLSFADSVAGAELTIDHFGDTLKINTADFGIVNPTKKYVIEGKGMAATASPNRFGNLIISFIVSYPSKRLSRADRDSLRATLSTIDLS